MHPPIEPMLAKLTTSIPQGDEWLYEPKWDGFRAMVFRDGDEVLLISRDGRDLNRYFPEMLAPLRECLPPRCVVDGEIVIAAEGGLEFDSLLLRIHPAESRVKLLSTQHPASFIAFDLLAAGEVNLMSSPAEERRAALEKMLPPPGEADRLPGRLQVVLTPQTKDAAEGALWFEGLERLGLDGLIAKRKGDPYSPGKRTMVKVKHQRTVDCVVGGYRLNKPKDGIGSLLLGLYDDAGTLHYVGHTSSFKAPVRRELLEQLQPLRGEGAFGSGRTPGGPSRWARADEKSWVALRPELVCEVGFDYMQGDRFRHAATFKRWRDDKAPQECTFEQIVPPGQLGGR